MHIAILEAGRTNPDMPAEFHHYPDMFETLFADQPSSADFHFSIVSVIDDVFPQAADDYDGYLVTGSAYGVYDEVPFIPKLRAFIRDIFSAGKPLVGVCFGHQIVAHALGGHAAKFDGGWGIGTMPIKMVGKADWIPGDIDQLDLIHVHQDQVITLPQTRLGLPNQIFAKTLPFPLANRYLRYRDIQNSPPPTPMRLLTSVKIKLAKSVPQLPVFHFKSHMTAAKLGRGCLIFLPPMTT